MRGQNRRQAAQDAREVARLRERGESCATCARHRLMGSQSVCRSLGEDGDRLTTAHRLCAAWCAP